MSSCRRTNQEKYSTLTRFHTTLLLGALACSSEAPGGPTAGVGVGTMGAAAMSPAATTGAGGSAGNAQFMSVTSSATVGTSSSTTAGGVTTASASASTTSAGVMTNTAASSSGGVVTTGPGDTSTNSGNTAAGGGGGITSTTGSSDTGTTGGTGTDCQAGKVVHFVYFVEADAVYSESQHADIEEMAYAFQQYWFEQLGVTFYLNEPIVDVIEADHDSTWYLETPDGIHSDERWYRLGNIKSEVYEKLRIQNFDPNHRVVNYPTTRHDGRVGGNFGGAWMDGDDLSCMAEPNGVNYPYPDGADAHCMGHVAHEFGHVLGLDHQGPQTDCMQYGFYNNSGGSGMCDFSPDNVAEILAEPNNEGWFEAQPGENCNGI